MLNSKKAFLLPILQLIVLTTLAAVSNDITVVKRNICDSYTRLLNSGEAQKERIREITDNTANFDIMIRELREEISDEKVSTWMKEMQTDGSWRDLNYADRSRSGWHPSVHAERLSILAKAYRYKESRYYGDSKLAAAIHKAMDYWFRGNFRCLNWWYNEIGVPKMLGITFLLMEDEMNDETKAKAIKCMENSRFGKTGQNSVWLAENVLVRALLIGDEQLLWQARNIILAELKINHSGEGIRPDWSFHQHGAQLQFGNYGLAFANTMAYWARILRGTNLALNEKQIQILRNYLLEGMSWIVWKGYMDISSCARQLFPNTQEGKSLSYGKALSNMMAADPEHADKYEIVYCEHVKRSKKTNTLQGFRYFPYSDFAAFRSEKWCATLKMSSPRVIGSEIVNSENLRGYYLGDGALYLYQRGDEFRDIFPVWDWTKIPGVTCHNDPQIFKTIKGPYFSNKNEFVGGVSDQYRGTVGMILDKNGISGRTSWFFTSKAIVCSGSHITAESNKETTTSVAQCLKRGEVSHWRGEDGRVAWYHDGIVYLFADTTGVRCQVGKQIGSWNRVANAYDSVAVEKEIFLLWVDHGRLAGNKGAYFYALIPNISPKEWKKTAANFSITDFGMNADAHWGRVDKGWHIVFYRGMQLTVGDVTISADRPCVALLTPAKKGWQIQAIDPLNQEQMPTVEIISRPLKKHQLLESD